MSYGFQYANDPYANRRVVYASAIATLDGDFATHTGTDVTGILNAELAGGNVELVLDGIALVTDLILWSNSTLRVAEGGGLVQPANAQWPIVRNAHRVVQKGGAFDPATCIDRDISVLGGTFDCNGTNKSSVYESGTTATWITGFSFFGVDGLYIERVKIVDSIKFAILLSNYGNTVCNNFEAWWPALASNQDGFHVHGPGLDVVGENWISNGGDDMIAINHSELLDIGTPEEQALPTSGWGPIRDVNVRGVSCLGPHLLRTLCSAGNEHGVVRITGISAPNMQGYHAVSIGGVGDRVILEGDMSGDCGIIGFGAQLNELSLDLRVTNYGRLLDFGQSIDSPDFAVFGAGCGIVRFDASGAITRSNVDSDTVPRARDGIAFRFVSQPLQSVSISGRINYFAAGYSESTSGCKRTELSGMSVDGGALAIGASNAYFGGQTVTDLARRDADSIGAKVGGTFFSSAFNETFTAFLVDLYSRFGPNRIDNVFDFQSGHQVGSGARIYGAKQSAAITGSPTFNTNGIAFPVGAYAQWTTGLPIGAVLGDTKFTVISVQKKTASGIRVHWKIGTTGANVVQQYVLDGASVKCGSDAGDGAVLDISAVTAGNFYYVALIATSDLTWVAALNGGALGNGTSAGGFSLGSQAAKIGDSTATYAGPNDIATFILIRGEITTADSQFVYSRIKSTIGNGIGLP